MAMVINPTSVANSVVSIPLDNAMKALSCLRRRYLQAWMTLTLNKRNWLTDFEGKRKVPYSEATIKEKENSMKFSVGLAKIFNCMSENQLATYADRCEKIAGWKFLNDKQKAALVKELEQPETSGEVQEYNPDDLAKAVVQLQFSVRQKIISALKHEYIKLWTGVIMDESTNGIAYKDGSGYFHYSEGQRLAKLDDMSDFKYLAKMLGISYQQFFPKEDREERINSMNISNEDKSMLINKYCK